MAFCAHAKYLIATEVATKENMYLFIIKFNGLTNIISILGLLVSLSLLWFNNFMNARCEELLGIAISESTEAVIIYKQANCIILGMYIGVYILLAVTLAVLSYLKQGMDEIFRVTLNRSEQAREYMIDREGITLVSTKGNVKTIDLEQEKLEFSNGHVVVTGKYGSTVYSKESIEEIAVKGNEVDMEVKYDSFQKRWCPLEGGV